MARTTFEPGMLESAQLNDTIDWAAYEAHPAKANVRAATTANITLSGTQTIDTVSLVAGNRVLVKNQTAATDNGIYVVASGAWSRAEDADSDAKFNSGVEVYVEEGTAGAGKKFKLATTGAILVGITSLSFTELGGSSSGGDMLKATYDSDDDGKVDAAEVADSVAWTGVTGKPSAFAPTAHASTHIPGGSDALPTAAAAGLANANAEGNAASFARSNHTHKRDVRVASGGTDVGIRNKLNFTGPGVSVTDDVGNDAITVNIPGDGPGSDSSVALYVEDTQIGTESRQLNLDGSFVAEEDAVSNWFDVSLKDELDSNARVTVRKNGDASDTGSRRRINFFEGTGIAISAVDDPENEEIAITITSTGGEEGGTGGHVIKSESVALAARAALNFVGSGVSVVDDAANDATVITINGGDGGGAELESASVRVNTFHNISSGVWTSVPFDEEVSDTNNFWDSGSPTLLTIPSGEDPALYALVATAEHSANATGVRGMLIRKNSSEVLVTERVPAAGTSLTSLSTIWFAFLEAGDTIDLQVYQNSGSTQNVQTETRLQIVKLPTGGASSGDATTIQGRAVADTAPTDGQAIVWDEAEETWKPGDVASGGGGTMEGTAGETIAERDAVRIEIVGGEGTAGRVYLTDATKASRSSKSWFAGFASAAATVGNSIAFSDNVIAGFTGLTPGATYYAGTTPGSITTTAPGNALVVGVALSATTLLCRKGLPPEILPDLADPLPTLAGGPVFLFEALRETGYADNDAVSILNDASGNGHDATQVESGAIFKTNIVNGQPVYRLDGNAYFSLGVMKDYFPSAATLFIVVNHTSTPGQFELYKTNNNSSYMRYIDGSAYWGAFRGARLENYPASVANTGVRSYTIVSSATKYQGYLDGVAQSIQAADFSNGAAVDEFDIDHEHIIGYNINPGAFHGDIALVAAWDSELSAPDIATVHDYIEATYGV